MKTKRSLGVEIWSWTFVLVDPLTHQTSKGIDTLRRESIIEQQYNKFSDIDGNKLLTTSEG